MNLQRRALLICAALAGIFSAGKGSAAPGAKDADLTSLLAEQRAAEAGVRARLADYSGKLATLPKGLQIGPAVGNPAKPGGVYYRLATHPEHVGTIYENWRREGFDIDGYAGPIERARADFAAWEAEYEAAKKSVGLDAAAEAVDRAQTRLALIEQAIQETQPTGAKARQDKEAFLSYREQRVRQNERAAGYSMPGW